MDEEQGKVIDGTARASQWRSSGRKPPEDPNELRADAPKSIASSLLVPADMLGAPVAPPAQNGASRRGDASQRGVAAGSGNGAAGDANHNLFLAADAAVEQPRGREHRAGSRAAQLVGAAASWLQRSAVRARRPVTFANPWRVPAVLALLVVAVIAAEVVTRSGSSVTRPHRTDAVAELARLRSGVLSIAAGPFAGVRLTTRSRQTRGRPTHRPPVHKQPPAHPAIQATAPQPASSSYAPPAASQSEPVQTPSQPAATASSSGGSSGSQRAGPSGPISLIGAGTTPSG